MSRKEMILSGIRAETRIPVLRGRQISRFDPFRSPRVSDIQKWLSTASINCHSINLRVRGRTVYERSSDPSRVLAWRGERIISRRKSRRLGVAPCIDYNATLNDPVVDGVGSMQCSAIMSGLGDIKGGEQRGGGEWKSVNRKRGRRRKEKSKRVVKE